MYSNLKSNYYQDSHLACVYKIVQPVTIDDDSSAIQLHALLQTTFRIFQYRNYAEVQPPQGVKTLPSEFG